MTRRLTRQGQERKRELMAHAAQLFAERGYDQTRVIDIVRAAGVAKGLFYWYFDNKDAMFRELIVETRRTLRQTQMDAVGPVRGPLAQVFAATAASVLFMADHRELYALMQIEGRGQTQFTDTVRDTTAVHAADTARILESGQRAGVIRADDDPVVLAYGLLGTVLHWVYFHRTGRVTVPIDDLADTIARWVVRALAVSDEVATRAETEALEARGAVAANG